MSFRTRASFVADNSLNVLAYLTLYVASPPRAQRWLERVGRLCPAVITVEAARQMMERLGSRGTCLSRSLAIAARCPDSEVVIGVQSPHRRPDVHRRSARSMPMRGWRLEAFRSTTSRFPPGLRSGALIEGRRQFLPEGRECPGRDSI